MGPIQRTLRPRAPEQLACSLCLWPVQVCDQNGCRPDMLLPVSQLEALCARYGYQPRGKLTAFEWLEQTLARGAKP